MSPRQFDLYVVEREVFERWARRGLWLVAHAAGAYYWAASLRRPRPKDVLSIIARADQPLEPTSFGFRPIRTVWDEEDS